jgi:CHASE2 domain-containing sensor protein
MSISARAGLFRVKVVNWLLKIGVRAQPWLKQLRCKGRTYWLVAGGLIALGTGIGYLLSKEDAWISLRYSIYQSLEGARPIQPYAQRTSLIVIGDAEYWKGELARRVPIKRSYLAKLVQALDPADPAVIALDFDLSSPIPDGSLVEHPDYEAETKQFIDVLNTIGRRRAIILPTTIGTDDHGDYDLESDIFHDLDLRGTMITRGYIALPDDLRQVPLSLPIQGGPKVGGTYLDSFAEAIVRAYNRNSLQHLLGNQKDLLVYGSYLRTDDFNVLQAGDVLTSDPDALKSQLAHRIVIVGGGWHTYAYERGAQIDTYFTPVGWIPGVFIHANYVEALLDSRIYKPLGEIIGIAIEALLALFVAMVFALEIAGWRKSLIIASLGLSLMVLTYVLWQNLGLFFDFFIPTLLVTGHFAFEQVRTWRADARKYRLAADLKQKEA